MSPPVLLLTHDSREARWIAQALARELNLVGIVLPKPGPRPPKQVWRRRVYAGIGPTAYELLLKSYRTIRQSPTERRVLRIERRLQAQAKAWLFEQLNSREPEWPAAVERKRVQRFNSPETRDWCAAKEPELLLVYGTPILRPKLIKLPARGCLNVHGSLLPEYRGTRSAFFQVLHEAWDTVGVTIHFIDPQVDTGKIVLQKKNRGAAGKDPYQIRAENFLLAREALPAAALGVLTGNMDSTVQGEASSPTFRGRDITIERRLQLLQQLGLYS